MRSYNNKQIIFSFWYILDSFLKQPNTMLLVDDHSSMVGLIQPYQLLEYINDVTNNDKSDDTTCDNANDYLMLDFPNGCPTDSVKIKANKNFTGDPRILIGEKCCLSLTGFSDSFWNRRYSS